MREDGGRRCREIAFHNVFHREGFLVFRVCKGEQAPTLRSSSGFFGVQVLQGRTGTDMLPRERDTNLSNGEKSVSPTSHCSSA